MKHNNTIILYFILFFVILYLIYKYSNKEGFLNDLNIGKWKLEGSTNNLNLSSSESGKTVIINSDVTFNGKVKIGSYVLENKDNDLLITKDSTGKGNIIIKGPDLKLYNRNDNSSSDPTYNNSPFKICNNVDSNNNPISEYCDALGLNNKGDFTIYRENNKGIFITNPDGGCRIVNYGC